MIGSPTVMYKTDDKKPWWLDLQQ